MVARKKPVQTDDIAGQPRIVQLQRLRRAEVEIPLHGLTPIIVHKWAEKSLGLMRDKQFNPGATKPKKEAKNPLEEATQSCYWLDAARTKPGMPATAFKAAMVGACRFFEQPTMTLAKLLFSVQGQGSEQLVPISGKLDMREDTPRNSGGTVDLRYRFQILDWTAKLRISFLPEQIDEGSIAALVDAAGSLGVGDWRPSAPKSATGTYGQWQIAQ